MIQPSSALRQTRACFAPALVGQGLEKSDRRKTCVGYRWQKILRSFCSHHCLGGSSTLPRSQLRNPEEPGPASGSLDPARHQNPKVALHLSAEIPMDEIRLPDETLAWSAGALCPSPSGTLQDPRREIDLILQKLKKRWSPKQEKA